MTKPLTESEREELLDELTKVHNVISAVVSVTPPIFSQDACGQSSS